MGFSAGFLQAGAVIIQCFSQKNQADNHMAHEVIIIEPACAVNYLSSPGIRMLSLPCTFSNALLLATLQY